MRTGKTEEVDKIATDRKKVYAQNVVWWCYRMVLEAGWKKVGKKKMVGRKGKSNREGEGWSF